jgi:hypothetical protein
MKEPATAGLVVMAAPGFQPEGGAADCTGGIRTSHKRAAFEKNIGGYEIRSTVHATRLGE